MINLAVIGTNFITDRLLEGVALCPGIQATAVYSRTMERAREYAAAHSLPLTFNSLDQLAACQDIDAVYIASPTCCHAAQAVQMLQAGKHVLCEKPIASNQRELNQMLQAADEQGAVLLEAIRAVFTPAYRWLQERLERIGPVRRVSLSFCQYSSRYDKFKNGVIENAFRPELSNGAIMDIGVYPLHLMVSLFGPPQSVTAQGVVLPGSIDGEGTVLARYPGMLAQVAYSKISDSTLPNEIQGEGGCLLFGPGGVPRWAKAVYRGGASEQAPADSCPQDMYYEVRQFVHLIHACSGASVPEGRQYRQASLHTMQVLDEARRQTGIRFPAD